MKQSIISFVVLALLAVSCQQAKQDLPTAYSPQETVPMEITNFETIQLEQPNTESGDALMKTLKNRQSTREYADTNISLKHLSEILWAANGTNRGDGKRTVPSALALYPIKMYAVLANGIYLYSSENHELQPVAEGDFRELAGLQPFVKTAPLNLVFIADYSKYQGDRPVPQEKWLYLAALDAGHCTQNIYLYCASEGLKTVVRAGAQEAKLLELLGLDENHQFVVAQTVGY